MAPNYVPAEKFPLGRTVATPGALESLIHDEIVDALTRHASGDWGNLDESDLASNERALLSDDWSQLGGGGHPAVTMRS